MRPLVEKWQSEGKRIVVYVDDGLGYEDSFQKAYKHSAEVKSDLIHSGFVPNVQKSIWTPVSETEWLGFIINLTEGCLILTKRRVTAIRDDIVNLLKPRRQFQSKGTNNLTSVNVRKLASVIGKIISTYLVVGSMSRIMTRAMHCDIHCSIKQFMGFKSLTFCKNTGRIAFPVTQYGPTQINSH